MLTTVNALFDETAQPPRRSGGSSFTCCHCGGLGPRTSNAQKMCGECRSQKRADVSESWRLRKQTERGGFVAGDGPCASCSASFYRRDSRQKLCPPCRSVQKKEYHAEYQRRRLGVVVPIGGLIRCGDCGCETVKRGGKQIRCEICQRKQILRRQKEADQGRHGSVLVIGEMMSCKVCSVQTVRRGAAQKFCETCRDSERRDRLSRAQNEKRWACGGKKIKGTTISCKLCGAATVRNSLARVYCDGCGPNLWFKCPTKKLNLRIGNGIRQSLRRGSKNRQHWGALVGYDVDQLRRHLERQFCDGMTWNNFGAWHIDHIRPLASFEFQTPKDPEFLDAWALTNLRPLWKADNLQKSDKRLFLL